uniref:Uncharacterized protein n=1 Tax=Romanomermis culicivorax TaxID=13658 RepID=A0A915IPQ6_ROMCU
MSVRGTYEKLSRIEEHKKFIIQHSSPEIFPALCAGKRLMSSIEMSVVELVGNPDYCASDCTYKCIRDNVFFAQGHLCQLERKAKKIVRMEQKKFSTQHKYKLLTEQKTCDNTRFSAQNKVILGAENAKFSSRFAPSPNASEFYSN